MNLTTAVIEKIKNPFLQAVIVLILFLIANGVVFLLNANGFESEGRMPWTLAIAFLLLFMVYNAVIGLMSNKVKRYWLYSIYSFAGLMFIHSFFAGKISGIAMDDAGSYRWLFFVFCPVYLFFIVMVTLIKKIVTLAEKDDTRYDKSNHHLN